MLSKLAAHLQSHPAHRHLFFVLCTLLTVALIGYHFGTFDQTAHIPFLKKYADPTLFPGDHFLDLRSQMYSFFWFIFIPFFKIGLLEPVMFAAHLFSIYLTFWAVWQLTTLLFKNSLSSLLTSLIFIFPHIGFVGLPIFEFSLLNRTFILPFLIISIILYLRQNRLKAFFLLGLLYNFHVVSVNFVFGMLLFASLVTLRKIGIPRLFTSLLLFLLAAAPVLIWRLVKSPIELTPHLDWFSIISKASLYHIFFLISPLPQIALSTLSGLGALCIFFFVLRHTPSSPLHRQISLFTIAILGLLILQEFSSRFFPITLLAQFQISRAGQYILIFALIYLADYLARLYQSQSLSSAAFYTLLAVSALSFTPLSPLVCLLLLLLQLSRRRNLFPFLAISVLLVTLASAFFINRRYRVLSPRIDIYPPHTPWYQAQIWAKEHTSRDAVFIAPPHRWWFYEPDWRVFSERSAVSTLSELLVGAFVPSYTDYWKPRFAAVAPGALSQFKGDYFQNMALTASAFHNLSPMAVQRISLTYHAAYLVAEKPYLYPFPKIYENSQFIIYRL